MDIKNRKHSTRHNGKKQKNRKKGINRGKFGSVRNIQGKIYVDFRYLGERVRESSELPWTPENVDIVREQLNRMHASIQLGTFRFGEVFPKSKNKSLFIELERRAYNLGIEPGEVLCKEYFTTWYTRLKESKSVDESTLSYYRPIIENYLIPFFRECRMAELGIEKFHRFYIWSRNLKLRKECISNKTLNKIMSYLKSICKGAADEFGWGNNFNPFRGYKKLKEKDHYDEIHPFNLEEQKMIISSIPAHWKPFFTFSFATGLRQSEQLAIKPEDINWEKRTLKILRAISRDEHHRKRISTTKNKSSKRELSLNQVMYNALMKQKQIYEKYQGEFFFCTPEGTLINGSNLRNRVWVPLFKEINIKYRPMEQIRHTFATLALSLGENPLWVARFMGHRDTTMIIKVYSKYVDLFNDGDSDSPKDGILLEKKISGIFGKEE